MKYPDSEDQDTNGPRLVQPLRVQKTAAERIADIYSGDAYASEKARRREAHQEMEEIRQEDEWRSALKKEFGDCHPFTNSFHRRFFIAQSMIVYSKWGKRPKTRKGQIRATRSNLVKAANRVLGFTEELVRLRDNLPASIRPSTSELQDAHGAARLSLLSAARMADELRADLDEHDTKKDTGTKTSTDRLFDDPLKQLVQTLAYTWFDEGRKLKGIAEADFLDAADRVHQLAIGQPLPDRPEIVSWASEICETP